MSPTPSTVETPADPTLNRRPLALVTAALGLAVVAFVVVVGFLAVEALRRPDVGASMYGKGRFFTGSGAGAYWGPFAVYSAVLLSGVVAILATVRRRLQRGERIGPPVG